MLSGLAAVLVVASIAAVAASGIPQITEGTVARELARVKHAVVLCFDPSASDAERLLKAHTEVYNSYLIHEDEVLYAAMDVTSTAGRKAEAKKHLKCKNGKTQLKYIHVPTGTRKSFKGNLKSAAEIQNWIYAKTEVAQTPDPRTMKAHDPLWRAMTAIDRVAGTYLDADSTTRAGSLAAMEQLVADIASAPFGGEHKEWAQKALDTHRTVVTQGWAKEEIQRELERLEKLKSNKHLTRAKKDDVEVRHELYRTYVERIPRIVHFIKTDGNPQNFKSIHYLAVLSAAHHLKPDKIIFHTVSDIQSPYWDKAKKYVTVDHIRHTPQAMENGVPIRLAAHQSDILRLEYLIRDGGIYMDWDVISLSGAVNDELLYSPVVFGAEKKILNYKEVLGVAWMAARPNSPFLKRFLKQMHREFSADCYSCHSTILGRRLALEHPEQLRVLNYTSFYHPGWELDGVQRLLEPNEFERDNRDTSAMGVGYFYAMHLFESHANFQRYIKSIDERWLQTVDTHFGMLMRPMLAADEKRERRNKRK